MSIEELKQLLREKKFQIRGSSNFIWSFNETTILVNNKPITQYSVYQENDDFFLQHNDPLESAEDYIINLPKEKKLPFLITLTPKFSKERSIFLELIYH